MEGSSVLFKDKTFKVNDNMTCKAKNVTGTSLELSDREKFCDIFRILGRSFGLNFGYPYMFYTFSLLPQLKMGSQPA